MSAGGCRRVNATSRHNFAALDVCFWKISGLHPPPKRKKKDHPSELVLIITPFEFEILSLVMFSVVFWALSYHGPAHVLLPFIQRRNLRIVYDAIGTLADAVGGELNQVGPYEA